MHHVVFVDVVDALHHHDSQLLDFLLWEEGLLKLIQIPIWLCFTAFKLLVDVLLQINSLLYDLHHDVDVSLVLEGLYKVDDVVVVEASENLDLFLNKFNSSLGDGFFEDYLDGSAYLWIILNCKFIDDAELS